jgi:hypothetical protein
MSGKRKGRIKKITLFFFLCLSVLATDGQELSADNLLKIIELSKSKMTSYLSNKNFAYAGKDQINDTIYSKYVQRIPPNKNNRNTDATIRSIYWAEVKEVPFCLYQTTAYPEFNELVKQFKKEGFYCHELMDSLQNRPLLFQHRDMTLRLSITEVDSIKQYNIQVQKKIFPAQKDINFADDLLAFTAHEYLEYYFGKNNVKNDIYYFSGDEIARCSVLFWNTKRQVVFIWKDEVNKNNIDHLLFGGQQKLESSIDNNSFVGESNWIFKSGIWAGMSLFELRKLNENDFKFYGGNAALSGSVLTERTGKLNFGKENIILGCMNCRDNAFAAAKIISVDEALAEQRILFILSIVLSPEENIFRN